MVEPWARLPSVSWRCVVLVELCAVGDDAAWGVHGNQGQLSSEQGGPDLCEHLRQPGTAVAGDLPGRDGIDELVVGEDLLEQPGYLSLRAGA
jgi:hypothetical protein